MIRIHSLAIVAALATFSVTAHADGPKGKDKSAEKPKDLDKGDKDKGDKDKGDKDKGDKDKAEKGKWEKLGERTVDGKIDKDTIMVGREDGVFDSIRVKVEGSAVEIFDIKVFFANGTTYEPKTKLVFGKDTWSRVFDLPGDKRVIRKVEMKYGNLPGGGKGRVELWGHEVVEAEQGWEKLGERAVNGKMDKDTIPVGAKDGTFTSIRLKVEGSAAEIFDIKVHFGNGTFYEPKMKLVFGKDAWTRVIDLPGDKRIVTKVERKYGNLAGGGKARVELWGKH